MVDSKFLIITTLCYVGIFVVVLVVCCCAWTRYMRNEGKFSPRRAKHRTRRTEREQTAEPSLPLVPVPQALPKQRQEYRYIGDFNDIPYTHHDGGINSNFGPEFRQHAASTPRPPYIPNHPGYALPPASYPRNYYPPSLATGTGTYDMDLQMDVGSNNTYGDTSHGGFSGDDFSDFQSSRYDTDSRPDLAALTSDGIGGLSCSMSDNVRSSGNNIADINGLRRGSDCIPAPTNTIDHDSENYDYDDDENVSIESSTHILPDELIPMSRGDCDGRGNTPSCSVQTLSRNESEQSLTEVK